MKMSRGVRKTHVQSHASKDSGLAPLFIAVLIAFVILVVLAAAGKSILTGLFNVPGDENSITSVTLQPMQATVSLPYFGDHASRVMLIKLSTPEKQDSFRYGANSTNAVYFVVKNFDSESDSVLVPGTVLYMYGSQWMLAAESRAAYDADGKTFYLPQPMRLGSSTTQVEFATAGNNAYVVFNENYGVRVEQDNFNVIIARQSKWQVSWDASSANPTLSNVVYTEGYVDGLPRGPIEVSHGFVSPSGTTLTQASSAIVQLDYSFLT